ncbi:MAG: hypothetical protein K6G92_04965 [Bacteroidaceae bacterium]|nr:hypothetical protein [Bacteroidaceae bacterium]
MPKMKLKVMMAKHQHPRTKQQGYLARIVTNGTAYYEDIARQAGKNTTLNEMEMQLGIALFMGEAAKMLRQGYIVDMGPIGKLYPCCNSRWVENPDDIELDDIRPSLYYRPSEDLAGAIRSAALQWKSTPKDKKNE